MPKSKNRTKARAVRRTKGQDLKVDFSPMPFGVKVATARFGQAAKSPAFLAAFCIHRHHSVPLVVRRGGSPRTEAYNQFESCLEEALHHGCEEPAMWAEAPKFFADIGRFLEAYRESPAEMAPRHPLAYRLLEAYKDAAWGKVLPPYPGEIVNTVAPVRAREAGARSEKRALCDLALVFHDRPKLVSALKTYRNGNTRSLPALARCVFSAVNRPRDLDLADLWERIGFCHGIEEVHHIGQTSYRRLARSIANHPSKPCGPVSEQLVESLSQELGKLHGAAFPIHERSIAGAWGTIRVGFRAEAQEPFSRHRKGFPLIAQVCQMMEKRLLAEVEEKFLGRNS